MNAIQLIRGVGAIMGCALLLSCDSLKKDAEVSGEVFVVTKGGENVRLGLVEITAIPEEQVSRHLERKNSTAKVKEEYLKKSFEIADEYYKSSAQTSEQAKKVLDQGESGSLDLLQATLAAQAIFKAAADAEVERNKCLEAYQSYPSAKFYFEGLPSGTVSTRTDSEGKYKISIPRKGRCAFAAHASRQVGGDTEDYYWLVWVEPSSASSSKLTLGNHNLATSGAGESAIKAKSSSFDLKD